MPVCESCRLDNPPGRDFCAECGYYLRWEPTVAQPAAPPDAAREPMATRPQRSVTRRPEPARARRRRDPYGGVAIALARDTADLTVEAGEELKIGALVRNRGELVDHYAIEVGGVPGSWWTAEPSKLHLVPYGSAGDYEQRIEVTLRPPRSPEARAGRRSITVRAVPLATAARPAEARTEFTIRPFTTRTTRLEPETVAGRRRGRLRMSVTNAGNAAMTATPTAGDGEDACSVSFAPQCLELAPGETAMTTMTLRPRRQIWLGRPRLHQLTATLADNDADACRATFRQRPWLPWWLAIAMPVVLAVVVAALTLWPRTAIVPDLSRARSAFQAQQMLQAAGLTLDPTQRAEPNADTAPGSVLKQSLAPGTKVRRGTAVALLLALGPNRHTVPDVVGLTLPQADKILADHFKLGTWQPDDAPQAAVIRSQWPAAGEKRQDGTPINVSLDPGTAPAPAVVPPHAASPTATPTATPTAGQALAYDDGTDLFLVRPGQAAAALSTDRRATQPAWTPDGQSLVYMRWASNRGRIWAFAPGSYPGKPLSPATSDAHRPAVAPDGTVVAYADRTDGSLCLSPLPPKPTATRCEADSRWAYERVAWSPDGRALLAVARGREPAAGDGLVRYTLPDSTAAAVKWRPKARQATLAVAARNVQHVALAPAGETLAITVGAPGQPGQVHAGSSTPGAPAPAALEGVISCEIAYTADGRLTTTSGPCAHATSKIEVHGENGERVAVGTGNGPAWQPAEVTP